LTTEALWETIARKTKKILPKDHFIRSAMILAGGTSLAQGLAIIFSPVLTRLYTPNDFGILVVYASLLTMSLNFTSLRYELAIPIPEDNQTAIDVLSLCVGLVFFTVLLAVLGVWLFSPKLIQVERFRVLEPYVWILPVGLFLAGVYNVFNYWAVRERMYPVIARTRISQGISGTLTQLGLGFISFGPLGLLLGQIVGECAGLGTLAKLFWKKNKHSLRLVSMANLRAASRRYKDFPLYQTSASLLNSAGLQVPPLLFAAYYGVEVAGWFYLTQKVLAKPISLVGASVSKAFLGEAARLAKEPHKLQKLFRDMNRRLFLLGIVPSILLAVAGQWIFTFVFGAKWVQSGVYVQVMAFVFLFKLTTDSVINFSIIERQGFSFSWALMRLSFVVIGILSAVWFGLSDFWAVVFFAAAMIVSYIIKYIMWDYVVRQMIVQRETAC